MKTLLLLLLCPVLALALPAEAPTAAAVDGDETPWLITSGGLYPFLDKQWKHTPLPEHEGHATPLALAPMNDGTVACLWRLDEATATLTFHRGRHTERLHSFGLDLPQGAKRHLFCDPRGSLWISGDTPHLTHLERLPQGGWKLRRHHLPLTRFAGPTFWKDGSTWKSGTTPLRVTADAKDRVWLWADQSAGAPNFITLRGALVFGQSGDSSAAAFPLHGAKGKTLTLLAPRDESTLWAGVYNDGLYTVDTATGALHPAATDEAFRHVEALYRTGEGWLALLRQPGRRTLWQQRGDAGWQPLVDPVELGDEAPLSPRPTLLLEDGTFLLGTAAEGLWVIPPGGGAPQRADWRNGFPLRTTSLLLPRPGGQILAYGPGGASYQGPLLAAAKEDSRVSEITTRNAAWETTPQGHLWTLLAGQEHAISQWDGEQWKHHPLPQPGQNLPVADLAWEAEGRLWLLHDSPEHPILIYTPATGQWEEHPSLQAAALARRQTPPRWTGRLDRPRLPAYSADGEIAFLLNAHLHYHDGNRWREHHRMSIVRRSGAEIGAPYFDNAGRLCIHIGSGLYVREGKWWLNQRPDPEVQARYGPWHKPPPIDPGGLPPHLAAVRDNRGTLWLMTPEGLFIHHEGKSRPLFPPPEPHPFRPAPLLREVWIDARGNAFLLTAGSHPRRYHVAPRTPPPRTQIAVRDLQGGRVEISLDPRSSGVVTIRWQIDDGPWQTTQERLLAFSFFTSGPHQFRAISTNEDGYSDARMAEATFTVQSDPEALWAALLADLQAPDYTERKAAITAMARHPEEARPRLLAARASAAADLRWWIDAALTELDTKAGANASPER